MVVEACREPAAHFFRLKATRAFAGPFSAGLEATTSHMHSRFSAHFGRFATMTSAAFGRTRRVGLSPYLGSLSDTACSGTQRAYGRFGARFEVFGPTLATHFGPATIQHIPKALHLPLPSGSIALSGAYVIRMPPPSRKSAATKGWCPGSQRGVSLRFR